MDSANRIILKVQALEYNKLSVILNDNKIYYCDLSFFSKVFCYPKQNEWSKVSIDSHGLDLIWPSRFEVHVDQLIHEAYLVEPAKITA